jgi:signal transduction histidine kinase/AraC-like DNA-binding protein
MKTKILVVDDETDMEPMLQQRFRNHIQQGEYEFSFATDGKKAISIIQTEPEYDVLLLDINMPEMDGLTLLGLLPDLAPNSKTIIVTAYSDMTNIRTAMNRGAFDFICKPINFKDLESTIEKTARHVRLLRDSVKVKAVADLKARFYDNITHDFRTPLTLILASVERLCAEYKQDYQLLQRLHTIERNARHLLRLINQLLELAKLETGQLIITPKTGNLGLFIGDLIQAFDSYALHHSIDISYHNDLSDYWIYDPEKIGQIAYNLIDNAIKFTSIVSRSSKGNVFIKLEAGEMVQLTVTDTGIGIPPSSLPFIFDRFYHTDSRSTGIGLSLVKELTELMGGHISVESYINNSNGMSGTTFKVMLPLKPTTEEKQDTGTHFSEWLPALTPLLPFNTSYSEAPLLLLVEDNHELLSFMTEILSMHYRIISADNGRDGWQLAQSELPDIIVSDIIIPSIDGYELTHLVKNTPATDHIAVILLTAKTAHDNRMTGLREGADDYLSKPFYVEELLLRLNNLVIRQKKLRQFYNQQFMRPDLPLPIETVQNEWLHNLYDIIDAQIDNNSLGVEWLAGQLNMSRKTLLRKVQSLTRLSPNELIRQYRLRKSVNFLNSGHNVSETAYMVGFETPAYFGQCFKEMYGLTPGEYMKSVRNNHPPAEF